MILPLFYVDDIIRRALAEDINYVDVATDYLIPETQRDRAYLVAKEDGVICGLEIAMRVFTLLDNTFAQACSLLTGGMLGHPVLENSHRQTLVSWLNGNEALKAGIVERF